MNLALSRLLNQYVAAGEVQPRDCEAFQLVCPHCGDRVTKETMHSLDDVRHFFSHATKASSETAACEVAVAALTPKAIREFDRAGRIRLLNALRKTLLKPALEITRDELQKVGIGTTDIEREMEGVLANDRFKNLAEQARRQVRESESKIRASFAEVAADYGSRRRDDQSDFSRNTQVSIGADLFVALTREAPVFAGVMAMAVLIFFRLTEQRAQRAPLDAGLAAVLTLLKGMVRPLLVTASAYHAAESARIPAASALPAGAAPRLVMAFDLLEVMSTILASIDYEPMLHGECSKTSPDTLH